MTASALNVAARMLEGSLSPSDHPDLLGIADRDYRRWTPADPGLRYLDTMVTALMLTARC